MFTPKLPSCHARFVLGGWTAPLLLLGLSLGPSCQAGTTSPDIISYQGLVKEAGARPTGTRAFRFKLYDALGEGNLLWDSTELNLTVTNGLYSILLGGGGGGLNDPIAPSIFETNGAVYLEVTYQGQVLTPRERLVSAAYAMTAKTVQDGAVTESKLAPNVVWKTNGNAGTTPGTQFVGTTDNQALEVKVNGARVLRLEPHADSPNIIGGYFGNTVSGGVYGATIGGGGAGGAVNQVTANHGTVGGGSGNTASNVFATVGGGQSNTANLHYATVGGGYTNMASGGYATVGGGYSNVASGDTATVAGGQSNTASGYSATVGGGQSNTASGHRSSVPGGWSSVAQGDYSFAAGRRAKANHQGAFVWGDSTDADVASSANDQFTARAVGGYRLAINSALTDGLFVNSSGNVGIGTVTPGAKLTVAGLVESTSGGVRFPDGTTQTTAFGGSSAAWSPSGNAGTKPDTNFLGTTDPQALVLRTNNSEVMRLLTDGNVGIGTASPGSKLTVAGLVESSSAGYKFPDGTTQTTAVGASWSLTGNAGTTPGTNFVGTTDNQALEVKVNSQRALRIEPNASCPNIIGGHPNNAVTSGAYGAMIGGGDQYAPNLVTDNYGSIGGGYFNQAGDGAGGTNDKPCATVAGGWHNQATGARSAIGGGQANTASSDSDTIAGGYSNTASGGCAAVGGGQANTATQTYASVGGGYGNNAAQNYARVGGGYLNSAGGLFSTAGGGLSNSASAGYSTVGGGSSNVASGTCSTAPGGQECRAQGDYSFAAGYHARALHTGTFVWADSSTSNNFNTTANYQFYVRASGGVKLYSNSGCTTGVELAPGSTSWGTLCDRKRKKNFRDISGEEVLGKIAAMPVTYWHYDFEKDTDVPHVGPVAQDFIGAFYPGADDKVISTQQADGVHFAAIKALEKRTRELGESGAVQEKRVECMEGENTQLREQNARLAAENIELAARTARLEAAVSRLLRAKQP